MEIAFSTFFANFWVAKLNPFSEKATQKLFSEKARQNLQDYFNLNWSQKAFQKMLLKLPWGKNRMFWTFENTIFHFFCKFLSDDVETIFLESEARSLTLFKFKFDHRKHFRKWFFAFFEWQSWTHFLGKRDNALRNFYIKSTLLEVF